jgi:predicted flap endonuclease-1-like 5' DNA nuclease
MVVVDEWTNDSTWYNALDLFEKYGVKVTRKYFKSLIKGCCDVLGVTREQLGIVAAPYATMYYRGEWPSVSLDAIETLAENGTDIIFIEKLDIVKVLSKYADKYGIALVNSRGHLADYAKDLARVAQESGANVSIVTDYDIPGVKIASELSESVEWLGVNEDMLRHFGLSKQDKRMVVPYRPKKKRIKEATFREIVESDSRFSDTVDIEFLKTNKIELDAILTAVGSERLWEYLTNKHKEYYPTRDYTRVIDRPNLESHYPEEVKTAKEIIDKYVTSVTEPDWQKIEAELVEVEGFIEDVLQKEAQIDGQLGKIVKEDALMQELGAKFAEVKPILDKMENALKAKEDEKRRKEQEEKERQAKEKAQLIKKYGDICSKYNLEIQDVEGIGPTTARILKEAGIVSVIDIASAKPEDLVDAAYSHLQLSSERREEYLKHITNYIIAAKKLLEEKLEEEDK